MIETLGADGPILASRRALATFPLGDSFLWPSKPMVPTAPYSPAISSVHPLRRHIGQSLGGIGERGATVEGFSDNASLLRTTRFGTRD